MAELFLLGGTEIDSFLTAAFWLSLFVVLWTYVGYPLATAAMASLRPRPLRAPLPDVDIFPSSSVSIVLAVRNEAQRLGARVRNLLDQDVAHTIREVLIVHNGSVDATPQVAHDLAAQYPRVRVLSNPGEEGKAGALNRGVAAATGEILVFVDARQTFPPGSLRRLLSPFGDSEVGGVSGRLIVPNRGVPSVRGIGTYWKLETWLRDSESASGSVVGASGAIHAVRRSLYRFLPPGLILDDVLIPMHVAMAGYRVVRAKNATAIDMPADGSVSEFRRKVRTLTGNIQLVSMVPDLLYPSRNPLFFRFVSHKLLRLAAPLLLIVMLLAALSLDGPWYGAVAAAQLSFYVLGALGLILPIHLLSVPAGFLLVNAAALVAIAKGPRGANAVWHDTKTLPSWPDPSDSVPAEDMSPPFRRREAS